MARPRKDAGEPTAPERLQNAFWDMLEEQPYHQITLAALVKRAGVNRNTFYYHYENLDDLAMSSIDSTLIPELPKRLMGMFITGRPINVDELDETGIMRRGLHRFILLVGPNGSPALANQLKSSVINLWLDAVNLRWENLAESEKMTLTFIVNGIVGILETLVDEPSPEVIIEFLGSDLGRSVFSTVASYGNIAPESVPMDLAGKAGEGPRA